MKPQEVSVHAFICDGCDTPIRVRGAGSKPAGYYIAPKALERVTQFGTRYSSADETLYFHTRQCLINAVTYRLSSLTDELIGKVTLEPPMREVEAS